jgi:alkylhydroperoxidase family enzyme
MTRPAPLPPDQWPPEMQRALAALHPPDPRHPFPPRDPSRPKGHNVLGLLALHPALATAYHTFNGHILFATTLSVRQRELLVLRVAHRRDAAYEWAQHAVLASDAGIAPDEVERIQRTTVSVDDEWSPFEAALLQAVDELLGEARIADATGPCSPPSSTPGNCSTWCSPWAPTTRWPWP